MVITLVVVFRNKGNKDIELEYEISSVQFVPDIKYIGSHYNYQGDLLLIYQRKSSKSSKNYFVGISDDKGKLLKEIYEIKDGEIYTAYINRASSFSDGKRVLIGGKINNVLKN